MKTLNLVCLVLVVGYLAFITGAITADIDHTMIIHGANSAFVLFVIPALLGFFAGVGSDSD